MEKEKIECASDDYKSVAKKVQERVKKELPIVQGLLDAFIEGSGMHVLPQAVHTIAVVYHNKSYKLLKYASALYDDLIHRGRPSYIESFNDELWASLKKSRSVIGKLHQQEINAYESQLITCRSEVIARQKELRIEAKKRGEKCKLPSVNNVIEQEKAYFQHVECDISSAIKSYIFLLILGYEPSEVQIIALDNMMNTCKEILRDGVAQHERTLVTTKKMLS